MREAKKSLFPLSKNSAILTIQTNLLMESLMSLEGLSFPHSPGFALRLISIEDPLPFGDGLVEEILHNRFPLNHGNSKVFEKIVAHLQTEGDPDKVARLARKIIPALREGGNLELAQKIEKTLPEDWWLKL